MKIDKAVLIRTALLIFALINQFLIVSGHSPFPASEEEVGNFVSTLVDAGIFIWTFWKNQNFTTASLEGQKVIDALKDGKTVEVNIHENN